MGRTTRTSRAAGALVVVGALLAGCGADGADPPDTTVDGDGAQDTPVDDPGDGAGADADDEAGDEAQDGGEAVVEVEGLAFTTPSLSVAAGTTVVWRNLDGVPHTATAGSPDGDTGEFDVSLPGSGEGSTTLDEPGTYPYYCTIHPSMTAELVVTDG